jgi:hypothetical protein
VGEEATVLSHLQLVTGMTPAQAEAHLRDAYALWERHNAIQWRLDLSVISSTGVEVREPRPVSLPRAVSGPEPAAGPDHDDCPFCRDGGHDLEPGSLTITPRYF